MPQATPATFLPGARRARADARCAVPASLALAAAAALACAPHAARAEGYDVLAECMALTADEDEIHGCLDNYLDIMDDNIGDLETFLRRQLDGEALAGFARSQSAFASYRRENCLWYLEFNEPRDAAEKIAKNCLARMSLDRLAELQALLVRDDRAGRTIEGFYVYGANRNSFRPCGTDMRYWVEGGSSVVGALQQGYSSLATAELQVMFASVNGAVDEAADAPVDHDGVLRVRSVQDVRVPSDGDCRLPDGSPPVTDVVAGGNGPSASAAQRVADVPPRGPDDRVTDTRDDRSAIARTGTRDVDPSIEGWARYSSDGSEAPAARARPNPVADPDGVRVPEIAPASAPSLPPIDGERLTAYFGAWLADCESLSEGRRCRVAVDLGTGRGDASGGDAPELALLRRGPGSTTVEIAFPDRAIGTASDVGWAIDGYAFGGGGEVAVGAAGTVLRIADRRFVGEELLPLMRRGYTLALDVEAGDGSAERLQGTLVGLTRALAFADGFVAGDGS